MHTPAGDHTQGRKDVQDQAAASLDARVIAAFADLPDQANDQALIELTVSWLLGKQPGCHALYLAGVASWLRACRDPLQAHPSQIEHWLEFMTVTPRGSDVPRPPAPGTLLQRLRAVSSWYNHLVAHQACDHSPAAGVRLPHAPKSARTPPQALGLAASATLVEHALARAEHRDSEATWRDAAVTAALFYTHTTTRTLITAQLTDLIGRADTAHPMTLRAGPGAAAGHHLIELPHPVTGPLRAYLRRRATRHHLTPPQLRGPLLVTAPTRRGTPGDQALTAQSIYTTIRKLARQVGLPPLSQITPCPTGARSRSPVRPGPVADGDSRRGSM